MRELLVSRSVEKKDSLVYSCTAHNKANKAEAYIRLSVIGQSATRNSCLMGDDTFSALTNKSKLPT
jgi:hypothetical protein